MYIYLDMHWHFSTDLWQKCRYHLWKNKEIKFVVLDDPCCKQSLLYINDINWKFVDKVAVDEEVLQYQNLYYCIFCGVFYNKLLLATDNV